MAPYSITNALLAERINTLCNVLAESARSAGIQSAKFIVMPGRKWARIVREDGPRNCSAHAFVNLANGDLHKTASWAQPAPGARYNLLREDSFATVLRVANHSTGYLYKAR